MRIISYDYGGAWQKMVVPYGRQSFPAEGLPVAAEDTLPYQRSIEHLPTIGPLKIQKPSSAITLQL
ncbi:hypothetical protein E2I00_008789 [Balaenoptera physalus]|uniref:Uncharacterized protein n=1 Tax=Balaenoptera physalus TaxID=9770 RepID=A0A643C082_BALPH|nr:hypothetical protein E2I00_008789 [Balaenoptera physalus]